MAKTAIVFILALVFLVIAFVMKKGYDDDNAKKEGYKQTYATVEKTLFSDTGNAWYYVSFMEDDKKIVAQTDHYSSETKSLNPGDQVTIGYYYVNENTARAVILDDRVIPVSNSTPKFYKVTAIIGAALFLVAVVMFVKGKFF